MQIVRSLSSVGILTLALSSGFAAAAPSLGEILGEASLNGVDDDGSQQYEISDGGAPNDNMLAIKILANAANSAGNTFGLYDLTDHTNTLQVFGGGPLYDEWGQHEIVNVSYVGGQFCVGDSGPCQSFASGRQFGVFISGIGGSYYSEPGHDMPSSLPDHVLAFDVSGSNEGQLAFADYIYAFEDLQNPSGGGEPDYNDLVVSLNDVRAVPIPAAAWLFGSGLIGLAGIARRKKAGV